MIPADARFIDFLVSAGTGPSAAVVTLNGVNIPLTQISDGELGGDISAFAGSLAQLTFSTPGSGGWLYFDGIQFSSIPEPTVFGLLALGGLFLARRPRQNFRR